MSLHVLFQHDHAGKIGVFAAQHLADCVRDGVGGGVDRLIPGKLADIGRQMQLHEQNQPRNNEQQNDQNDASASALFPTHLHTPPAYSMPGLRGYYSFFICWLAVLAIKRFVPTPSKAISSRASLPMGRTVRIMPRQSSFLEPLWAQNGRNIPSAVSAVQGSEKNRCTYRRRC